MVHSTTCNAPYKHPSHKFHFSNCDRLSPMPKACVWPAMNAWDISQSKISLTGLLFRRQFSDIVLATGSVERSGSLVEELWVRASSASLHCVIEQKHLS